MQPWNRHHGVARWDSIAYDPSLEAFGLGRVTMYQQVYEP